MSDHATTEAAEQLSAYTSQALGIVAALDEYEETHPKGAPCFFDELQRMKAAVSHV